MIMHQSIQAAPITPPPPPPGQMRGVCAHCQSRGSGLTKRVVSDSKSKRGRFNQKMTSSLSPTRLSVKDWTKLWRFLKVFFLEFIPSFFLQSHPRKFSIQNQKNAYSQGLAPGGEDASMQWYQYLQTLLSISLQTVLLLKYFTASQGIPSRAYSS